MKISARFIHLSGHKGRAHTTHPVIRIDAGAIVALNDGHSLPGCQVHTSGNCTFTVTETIEEVQEKIDLAMLAWLSS